MTPRPIRASTGDPTVDVVLRNPVTEAATLQLAVPSQIQVILTNNTTAAIALKGGDAPVELQIFMPDAYFSPDQTAAMSIALTDWAFTYIGSQNALDLTYAGPDTSWAVGAALTFTIRNVFTSGKTGETEILLNPANIENPEVPIQLSAPLTVVAAPSGAKPKLSEVLQVSLENQGIVYVSTADDPLYNTLVLNLKNTGTAPIYIGATPWTVAPKVKVYFNYGSNPGDLAPANDPEEPPIGSAWNIDGHLEGKQGGSWTVDGPGRDAAPAWVLSPANDNTPVLGAGGTANITFGFSRIVSITQAGHTQMHLDFSDFRKDADTLYDQGGLVLDVLKLNAPPTRGLLSLFSRNGVIFQSGGANAVTKVKLTWKMLYVASVNIITSYPGMRVETRPYRDVPALHQDSYTVIIPGSWNSMPVTITLQAFDKENGYLNSLQLTVSITSNHFVDSRDGKVYPAVQVGNKYWMAHNLDFNDPHEWNNYYDNYSSNGERYGRLYSGAGVLENVPDGWRLPSQQDWESLIASFDTAAYAALMEGGTIGFSAQLGGTFQADSRGPGGRYAQITQKGYYWTSTPDGAQLGYVLFDSGDRTVTTGNTTLYNDGCSVRYCKDI